MKNFIALDSEKVTDLYMMLAEARHCMEDYLNMTQKLGHRSSFTDVYTRRIKLAENLEAFLVASEAIYIEEAK